MSSRWGLVLVLCFFCVEAQLAGISSANHTSESMRDIMGSMKMFQGPEGQVRADKIASVISEETFSRLSSQLGLFVQTFASKVSQDMESSEAQPSDSLLKLLGPFAHSPRVQEVMTLVQKGKEQWPEIQSVVSKIAPGLDPFSNETLLLLQKRSLTKVTDDVNQVIPTVSVAQSLNSMNNQQEKQEPGANNVNGPQVTQPTNALTALLKRGGIWSRSSPCPECTEDGCHWANMTRVMVRWVLLSLGFICTMVEYLRDRTMCFGSWGLTSMVMGLITDVSDVGLDYVGPAEPMLGIQILGVIITALACVMKIIELVFGKTTHLDRIVIGDKLWLTYSDKCSEHCEDDKDCDLDYEALGMGEVLEGSPQTLGKRIMAENGKHLFEGSEKIADSPESLKVYPAVVRDIVERITPKILGCQDYEKLNKEMEKERRVKVADKISSTLSTSGELAAVQTSVANLMPEGTSKMLIVDWFQTKASPHGYYRGRGGIGSILDLEDPVHRFLESRGDVTSVDSDISALSQLAMSLDSMSTFALTGSQKEKFQLTPSKATQGLRNCGTQCGYGIPEVLGLPDKHIDLCVAPYNIRPTCGYVDPTKTFFAPTPILRVGSSVDLRGKTATLYSRKSRTEDTVVRRNFKFVPNAHFKGYASVGLDGYVVDLLGKDEDHEYLIAVEGRKTSSSIMAQTSNLYFTLPIDELIEGGIPSKGQYRKILLFCILLLLGGLMIILILGVTKASNFSWFYPVSLMLFGLLFGYSMNYILKSRTYECKESLGSFATFFLRHSERGEWVSILIFTLVFGVWGTAFAVATIYGGTD